MCRSRSDSPWHIVLEEIVDGTTFYYIQVDGTRKKGFLKAEYVAESAV